MSFERHTLRGAWLAVLFLSPACSEYDVIGNGIPRPGVQPSQLEPSTIQDDFIQRPAAASDILFVIDDSASMGEEQQNLVDNFDAFAQWIDGSDVDWHLGVVRGDLSSGSPNPYGQLVGSPSYLQASTDAASSLTSRVTQVGESGSGVCESGLEAAFLAIADSINGGYNAGFYRPEASLVVIIVSDEDDQTPSRCSLTAGGISGWARWFTSLKANPDDSLLGIIAGFDTGDNTTPAGCTSGLGDAVAGDTYRAAADAIDGTVTWSICSSDWEPALAELGIAAAGLTREFNLSRVPAWDFGDWDGDGDTDEPAVNIEIDRLDGNGFVDVQPVWSATPDAWNPWSYDRTRNAVTFTIDTMPSEGWELRAVYPNSEEG